MDKSTPTVKRRQRSNCCWGKNGFRLLFSLQNKMSNYQAEAYHDVMVNQQHAEHENQQPNYPSVSNYPTILGSDNKPVMPNVSSYFVEDGIPTQPFSIIELVNPLGMKKFIGTSLARLLNIVTIILAFVFLGYWVVVSSVSAFNYKTGYGVFVLLFTLAIALLSFLFIVGVTRMIIEAFLSLYILREKRNNPQHQI